jgi:hypothetical protein
VNGNRLHGENYQGGPTQASVTVPMAAPADKIWNIVADVRNT